MSPLPDQIRSLLTEDRTEAAIDALLAWAKANYVTLYDQCVLLRARWEKIEQESNIGLISREEAMRQTSQVNAALLTLLHDMEARPAHSPPTLPASTRRGWLLPALFGGVLLIGLAAFFLTKQTTPGDAAPAEKPMSAVNFPQGKAVTLVENNEEVSYEILDAQLEKLNPGEQRLSLRLLCSPMLSPRRAINFWAARFRFTPLGQSPLAPSNNLNLVAESHASTEGELQFVLPAAVRGGTLRVKFYEKEATLEMAW